VPEERRSFSRVAVCLDGWIRRLPGPDATPALREFPDFGETAGALRTSGLPEAAASFLLTMDAKLDAILSLLSRETLLADFPLAIQTIEISGGGVTFLSQEHFEIGEHLEIVLALRKLPFTVAGGMGRIERKELRADGATVWILAYTRLREHELDEIVRFVLQEERRSIREIKLA